MNEQKCRSSNLSENAADHPFAVVVKPTDRCNLACRYCYVTHRAPVRAMSSDVLEALIAAAPRMAQRPRVLHFIWHGGEPLLLGRKFFEQVLVYQSKHCREWHIDNCVQTNGTLLDEEFARFFAQKGFAVSLSVDGPAWLHDRFRRSRRGTGSHRQVMAAVDRLRREKQIIGAVLVLTRETAQRVSEVYEFMKRSGIQFRVNPIVAPERNSSPEQLRPDEYGRAMCELFDLWLADEDPPHIDPIHLIVGNMLSDAVWGCDFRASCCRDVIAINADGNVYPCGQLAGRHELLLGNVLTDSPSEIIDGSAVRRLREERCRVVERCEGCEFLSICAGGCMATAWIRHRDVGARDYFCEGRKMLFEHVRSKLLVELRRTQPRGGISGNYKVQAKGRAARYQWKQGSAKPGPGTRTGYSD